MKIGYLMQSGVPDVRQQPPSGPAVHVKSVIEELKCLGHQVRLIFSLDSKIWKSDDLEHYEPISIHCHNKDLYPLLEKFIRRLQHDLQLPYFAWFDSSHFAQACIQELVGYDIFYERMGWMGYGGQLAAHRLKIPLIFEVNGDHLNEMDIQGNAPHGLQRQISIRIMRRLSRKASLVVASGEGWRNQFITRYQGKPEKVSVVENGSELVRLLARNQLRAFIDDKDDTIVCKIVYLGGFEPWHGLTVLVRAVATAIRQGASIDVTLIGSGPEESKIIKLAQECGIENYVTFTGRLPASRFLNYLAGADIGVSPYCGWFEYSGLKLLDYKAAGLATIASGENGKPTVLQHGISGWIVPPCDEDALANAILELAHNPSLRKKIGRQARIEAERYHSWKNTAQELEKIFSQAVREYNQLGI